MKWTRKRKKGGRGYESWGHFRQNAFSSTNNIIVYLKVSDLSLRIHPVRNDGCPTSEAKIRIVIRARLGSHLTSYTQRRCTSQFVNI